MAEATDILQEVREQGFDGAIAIATNAEVEANAACGQMSLVTEA